MLEREYVGGPKAISRVRGRRAQSERERERESTLRAQRESRQWYFRASVAGVSLVSRRLLSVELDMRMRHACYHE